MADKKIFTLAQVSQHKSKKDCWLVVNGRVLNVASFLDDHPGGEEVILEVAGKDATKQFVEIGHSNAAQSMLSKYQVGVLQGYSIDEAADGGKGAPVVETKKKEMSAFVIKGDGPPKFAAFLEFFVPLLVAGSYFSYRYLANTAQMV